MQVIIISFSVSFAFQQNISSQKALLSIFFCSGILFVIIYLHEADLSDSSLVGFDVGHWSKNEVFRCLNFEPQYAEAFVFFIFATIFLLIRSILRWNNSLQGEKWGWDDTWSSGFPVWHCSGRVMDQFRNPQLPGDSWNGSNFGSDLIDHRLLAFNGSRQQLLLIKSQKPYMSCMLRVL